MNRLKGSKRVIAWVMAIICTVCYALDFTLLSSAGQGGAEQGIKVCRIKNSFSNGDFPDNIFLYENSGQVYYGTPENETDLRYYWVIETDGNGVSKIRNAATGNYMNYANETDYNEPMGCAPISEGTNNEFVITDIVDDDVVKHNIIAETNSSLVVHYQQLLGHAQCSNWAQAGWGTAQWLFEYSPVRIRNSFSNHEFPDNIYLYENNGQVLYGAPESDGDLRYHWIIVNESEYSRIMNMSTGHFMNYVDQSDYNEAMGCADISPETNNDFTITNITDGDVTKHNIIASTNSNLVVHYQQLLGHAQCSNWAQAGWGTAQWLFVSSVPQAQQGEPVEPGEPEEPEEPAELTSGLVIKIRNSYIQDAWLYEEDGKVYYGKPDSVFDLSYYWVIENDVDGQGNSRIRNAATGHYMNYVNQADYNDPITCVNIKNTTNVLFNVNSLGDSVYNIIADTNPNFVVHIEQQYGHAQCSNWAQASWGTAKWIFEDAGDKTPQGLAFKIQNSYTTTTSGDAVYLYESDGEVLYGPLDDPSDMSFYWIFSLEYDGSYTVKNWKTGHFITYKNQNDYNLKMRCLDYSEIDSSSGDAITFNIINIDDNGTIKHNLQSAVNPDIRIHTENFDHPVCSNWAQNFFGTAQWLFIDAIASAPTEILTPNGYTRIRNFWSGQYLYESEGKVKYGQPASHDPHSHWDIIEDDGLKLIKNVATGQYVVYVNQTDFNDPVGLSESGESALVLFNITDDVYEGITVKRIAASENPNLILHVEQQTGYAQCSNWAQPTWGSSAWIFEPASDDITGAVKEEIPLEDDPAAQLKEGDIIRLKNSWREMYLYQAEDGKVAYGNVSPSDLSFQWVVELEGDNIRLRNRESDKYISVENDLGYAECVDLDPDTLFNQWEIVTAPNTFAGLKTIRCAGWSDDEASGEQSYYLHTEGDKGYAEYGPIPPSWGSPQWIISRVSEDDPSTGYVRFKNKTTNNYLFEKDGKVAFGPASEITEGNALSHWVIERTIRYTRIRNRATGNYISAEGITGLLDPLATAASANDLNSVWIIEDAGEGSFTIENMNKDHWFIHNSNAAVTPFAQLSKIYSDEGALWILEDAPAEISINIPAEYTLIKNRAGQYLYENKNGVALYGNPGTKDTSYQWRLIQDGESYTIVNRFTGHYLTIENNRPFLECSTGSTEAAHWNISVAPVSNYSILANASSPNRFINTNAGLGFAQCTVLSNEKTTAQWYFEAPSEGAPNPVYQEDDLDTSTPVVSGNQYFALRNKLAGKYISDNEGTVELNEAIDGDSFMWSLEDFNGNKRIRNKASGNYLQILSEEAALSVSDDGDTLNCQWVINDFLGYNKIGSVYAASKYLYVNGSLVKAKVSDNSDDMLWSFEPVPTDIVYEAEKAFLGGKAIAAGNCATGFNNINDRVVFSVYVSEAGSYDVSLGFINESGTTAKFSIVINGAAGGEVTLPSGDGEPATVESSLTLHKGINTIAYRYTSGSGISVDSLTVKDSINTEYRGATLPFITYEAEDSNTNGEVIGPSVEYYTFASESSGRKAVALTDYTDYIEFELAEEANAFVIRYVIPDAAQGGGTTQTVGLYANGQKIEDIELSSRHSWVYGSYPWTNDPADGKPHRYYEEIRVLLDDTLPAGTAVKIRKNNEAEYCVIDLVDAEKVDPPYEKPEGFLSITDFGAVANDGIDDTDAMNDCIAAARAQNKGVWIPAGTFHFLDGSRGVEGVDNTRIEVPGNVIFKGAGMWHTALKGPFAGFMVKGSNTGFYDLTIEAEEVTRVDADGVTGIESDYDTPDMKNLTVQNIWFNHTKTGMWLHNMDNAHIVGNRVRNTYADGLHLSRGTTNSVIEQNHVRYTGDDGIALWSQEHANVNDLIRFNTVELPWLANNISMYGGHNNKIQDNIIKDTVAFGGGINISSNFDPMPFTGSVIVERNDLIRAGGHEYNFNVDYGAIRIDVTQDINADVVFSGNNIYDSSYQGITVHGPSRAGNLVFENTVIDGTGTWGVNAVSGSKGNVTFANLIIRNAGIENVYNPTPAGENGLSFAYPESWNEYCTYMPVLNGELSVTGKSTSTVSLDWEDAESSIEIDKYIVLWPGQVRQLAGGTTSLTVAGLSANTVYTFKVFAIDIYGNQSNILSVSEKTNAAGTYTPPAAPSAPPASDTIETKVENGVASVSKQAKL
ncbi:MAG: CBM35 domain-containing protein [Acetivibrionales bacterium]